jgi:hypothetical protein
VIPVVASVLTLWLALVFLLGAAGAFVRPAGAVPVPILVGVTAPLVVFLAALSSWRGFRGFVSTLDLRLVTTIHSWRFLGLGFLALYANGVLPGFFAWPAGLGDIVIGVTAPWMMLALIRRPAFAAGRLFVLWNLFGILDLIVALGTGALGSGLAASLAGEVTTGPMARLPLVLVPAFFVPLLFILHLVALLQARRLRGAAWAATELPGTGRDTGSLARWGSATA